MKKIMKFSFFNVYPLFSYLLSSKRPLDNCQNNFQSAGECLLASFDQLYPKVVLQFQDLNDFNH